MTLSFGTEPPLPRLREDLALLPGPPARDGSPTWTIHDPARDRYIRIGWKAMEMLARWGLGRAAAVARAVSRETTAHTTPAEVEGLARFLHINDLVVADDPAAVARLTERKAARRTGLLHRAVHNYLFFRIPLARPDAFLKATLPLAAPFFTAGWRWAVALAALLGLFLVSRQWDVFAAGFADLMSWDGAVVLAGTLAVVKILHELGHGYTARRHGCPVPSMGVAFLVLWPVLYTDTTHAYRLVSRRQRLEIAAGGIMVELAVAALATLMWGLLPDGPLRTAAHAAATITWVGTLAINLNPFMRFDGYYLLADALDIPNLQDRAFALGKWWLRETLFGLEEPPPEAFRPGLRRFLVAYAVAVWVYRFFLFLGIALLVYGLAFKALGIILMTIEIVWFIALPVVRELRAWWARRHRARFNRQTAMTLAALGLLAAAAVVPWPWPVAAPAVLLPAEAGAVHAPVAARVSAVHVRPGDRVSAGDPLVTLESPDLAFEAERAGRRIASLELLVQREAAVAENAENTAVLRRELETTRALARGLVELSGALVLRAPVAGRVTDMAAALAAGQWVRPDLRLARVVGDGVRAVAFVAAGDLVRIEAGAAARFVGEDPLAAALPLTVTAVDPAAVLTLDQPVLASTRGGPLAVSEGPAPGGQTIRRPLASLYRVTLGPRDADTGSGDGRTLRGRVWIEGPPVGLIERAWRTAAAVLVRESGF